MLFGAPLGWRCSLGLQQIGSPKIAQLLQLELELQVASSERANNSLPQFICRSLAAGLSP